MGAPDQTLEHKGHSVTVGGFDALLVRTVPAPQGQRTRGVPQGLRGSSGPEAFLRGSGQSPEATEPSDETFCPSWTARRKHNKPSS